VVLERYRHVLARDILSSEIQTPYDESEEAQQRPRRHGVDSCETDLWTGSDGVVWLDVRAAEGPPPSLPSSLMRFSSPVHPVSLTGAPYSSHSHQPLEYNDLLRKSSTTSRTGTDSRPEDSQHEYASLLHSIQQHRTHCIELLSHLTPTCPPIRTLYDLSPIATPEIRLEQFQQIATQIERLVQGSGSDTADGDSLRYCALLLIQRTFLDAILEISVNLSNLIGGEMSSEHSSEDEFYRSDAMNFHNRILSEVLAASSMLVGKGHFSQIGFSSSQLNNGIAKLAAMALGLSRQLVSRPILLHQQKSLGSSRSAGLLLPPSSTRLMDGS
jgi:hypothetical protein